MNNPLMEVPIAKANKILIHFRCKPDVSLREISEACDGIQSVISEDALLVFGANFNDDANYDSTVIIISSSFDVSNE